MKRLLHIVCLLAVLSSMALTTNYSDQYILNQVYNPMTRVLVITGLAAPMGHGGTNYSVNYIWNQVYDPVTKTIKMGIQTDPAPAPGQVLIWNGAAWVPGSGVPADSSAFAWRAAIADTALYALLADTSRTTKALWSMAVKDTTPTVGNVLVWSGSEWVPAVLTVDTAGFAWKADTLGGHSMWFDGVDSQLYYRDTSDAFAVMNRSGEWWRSYYSTWLGRAEYGDAMPHIPRNTRQNVRTYFKPLEKYAEWEGNPYYDTTYAVYNDYWTHYYIWSPFPPPGHYDNFYVHTKNRMMEWDGQTGQTFAVAPLIANENEGGIYSWDYGWWDTTSQTYRAPWISGFNSWLPYNYVSRQIAVYDYDVTVDSAKWVLKLDSNGTKLRQWDNGTLAFRDSMQLGWKVILPDSQNWNWYDWAGDTIFSVDTAGYVYAPYAKFDSAQIGNSTLKIDQWGRMFWTSNTEFIAPGTANPSFRFYVDDNVGSNDIVKINQKDGSSSPSFSFRGNGDIFADQGRLRVTKVARDDCDMLYTPDGVTSEVVGIGSIPRPFEIRFYKSGGAFNDTILSVGKDRKWYFDRQTEFWGEATDGTKFLAITLADTNSKDDMWIASANRVTIGDTSKKTSYFNVDGDMGIIESMVYHVFDDSAKFQGPTKWINGVAEPDTFDIRLSETGLWEIRSDTGLAIRFNAGGGLHIQDDEGHTDYAVFRNDFIDFDDPDSMRLPRLVRGQDFYGTFHGPLAGDTISTEHLWVKSQTAGTDTFYIHGSDGGWFWMETDDAYLGMYGARGVDIGDDYFDYLRAEQGYVYFMADSLLFMPWQHLSLNDPNTYARYWTLDKNGFYADSNRFSLTGPGITYLNIENDWVDFQNVDSVGIWGALRVHNGANRGWFQVTDDSAIIDANKPMRIGHNSIKIGTDGLVSIDNLTSTGGSWEWRSAYTDSLLMSLDTLQVGLFGSYTRLKMYGYDESYMLMDSVILTPWGYSRIPDLQVNSLGVRSIGVSENIDVPVIGRDFLGGLESLDVRGRIQTFNAWRTQGDDIPVLVRGAHKFFVGPDDSIATFKHQTAMFHQWLYLPVSQSGVWFVDADINDKGGLWCDSSNNALELWGPGPGYNGTMSIAWFNRMRLSNSTWDSLSFDLTADSVIIDANNPMRIGKSTTSVYIPSMVVTSVSGDTIKANVFAPISGDMLKGRNFSSISLGTDAGVGVNSNFQGDGAGFGATYVSSSNFLGYRAGYQASMASSSNFFGYQAGYQATEAAQSNFFGSQAGYAASVNHCNFLGAAAGYQTAGWNSNFLGNQAGYQATDAGFSNFLGGEAGYQATNAGYSNFLGYWAGYRASGASSSNFLGSEAGYQATNAGYSNFLGGAAGYRATNAPHANFFGYRAGAWAFRDTCGISIGRASSDSATGKWITAFGDSAAFREDNSHVVIFGKRANADADSQFYIGGDIKKLKIEQAGTNLTAELTADSCIVDANKPMRIGHNTIVLGTDGSVNIAGMPMQDGQMTTKRVTVGDTSFGKADVTIDSTNGLRMKGSATVWDDLVMPGINLKAGTVAPTLANYGGSSVVQLYGFAGSGTNDEALMQFQLPHAWKEGSDSVYFHLHLCPSTTPTAADTSVWFVNWFWSNIGSTQGSEGVDSVIVPMGTTQWEHLIAPFKGFPGAGKTISSIITMRIQRRADHAKDTYTQPVQLMSADIHYEIDALGSNTPLPPK